MGALPRALALAAVGASAVAIAVLALWLAGAGSGDEGPRGDFDAQALAIERQLLCPQCTNERLDVCNLAICVDMKRFIRDQLIAGTPPDEIVLYFRTRYGQRVLAEIPREGFNLVLFGWVGGSVLLVALGGALTLARLRRATRARAPGAAGDAARAATAPNAAEERWLDAQLEEERVRDG